MKEKDLKLESSDINAEKMTVEEGADLSPQQAESELQAPELQAPVEDRQTGDQSATSSKPHYKSGQRDGRDGRGSRQKQDTTQIHVVRVCRPSKMTKGGRRFNIGVLVIVGDQKEKIVGIGYKKGRDVALATEKAVREAKRNMFRVPLREGRTLHYDMKSSFGASSVLMRAAPAGTGIIAGGPLRPLFDILLGGHGDIVAKCFGSRNPLNVLRAAIKGLQEYSSPKIIASKRGKTIQQLLAISKG